MIDLLNDLTLNFISLIHNFEFKTVDINFKVLPTIGTIVTTRLNDWKDFNISFIEDSVGYTVIIGKSKDYVQNIILEKYSEYITHIDTMTDWQPIHDRWSFDHNQWVIEIQNNPGFTGTEPEEPITPKNTLFGELSSLFEYINNIGIKI